MKSTVLEPTPKNLLETLKDDLLERNQDIYRFTQLLNAIEGSYSIALDGRWGSGKTFFVKQTKMVLDAYNTFLSAQKNEESENIKNLIGRYKGQANELDIQKQLYVSVYYDAWANDNDTDPAQSLVYSIMQNDATDYSSKFKETGKGLIEKAAAIATVISGRDINALVEVNKKEDLFTELMKQKSTDSQITDFLNSLLTEKGDRLVIFVDELDRCRPDYAVRLLERIKHYFSNDRIMFVFSVNIEQLQHTVRQYYGNDFDACRYLDRFFDLRVELPPANMDKFYQKLGLINGGWVYKDICKAVVDTLKLSLRETTQFYQTAKGAAFNPTNDLKHVFPTFPEKAIKSSLQCIVPILIGLKISNDKLYRDFVQGKDSSPLIEIFKDRKINPHVFQELLSNDETYATPTREGQKVISIEDKFKEVYNALFIHDYTKGVSELRIGNCLFIEDTRKEILKTASLLSKYSDFTI